jgi:hypothetical protein
MDPSRIHYIIDKNEKKLLPHQYYDGFKLISIPMVGKKALIPGWPKKTKTVVPHYMGQNIGILTGKINNITVLDIDIKDDGMKYWNKLMKEHPDIKTPTVQSPGGSLHFYFKYNKNIPNMNRILIDGKRVGWDIKSDGSIITSPPSLYPDTIKRYKWLPGKSLDDVTILTMPKWLENYILHHLKLRNVKMLMKENKSISKSKKSKKSRKIKK